MSALRQKIKLEKIKNKIHSLSQQSLARNTLWMLLAQGLRIVLQAVYFVIIARTLGVEQYGAFVATASLIGIIAPFASIGTGNILIKNVSRNKHTFNHYWGNSLFITFIFGLVLLILVALIARLFLPQHISLILILIVATSDLIFARIIDISGQAFQAVTRLSKTALISILPNMTKVIAALAFVNWFPNARAEEWSFFYLVSTVLSAIIAVLLVQCSLGSPKLAFSRIKPEIIEGFYFSISLSAQNIYNDIDKTMLGRLSSLAATGIYASAYRLIDVAFVPVRSLLYAAYTKFFQQGNKGIAGTITVAQRLSPIASLYGAIAGISLYLFAPVVPYILGDEYADSVEALRWLAPLPLFKSMHYFAADSLTGAGFQGLRSAVQMTIAAFNFLVNLWLIPLYAWKGAAWTSLASDGLLMISLWVFVAFLYQQQAQKLKEE